jgi:hypothetical protein
VVVLADFGFFLFVFFKFGVFVLVEKPFENGFLNLLIVLIFKEFVSEELH